MINVNIKKITKEDIDNNFKGISMQLQDVFSLMTLAGIDSHLIVEIDPYDFDNDPDKIKETLEALTSNPAGDHIVITSCSYVSTKEFPEDEYYCEEIDTNCDKTNKKKLPLDEIINRQNKILEDAGFENINEYCQLEFSEVYIWNGNEDGERLIYYVNDII